MHEKSAVWSGFPLESAVLHFLPCTVSCSGPLADSRRIARDQIQEGFLSGSDQIRCNRPKNVINVLDLYCILGQSRQTVVWDRTGGEYRGPRTER